MISLFRVKYVLSVLDVFSRFIQLTALPDRSADTMVSFRNFCIDDNIRYIRSRSHHPQNQGKMNGRIKRGSGR